MDVGESDTVVEKAVLPFVSGGFEDGTDEVGCRESVPLRGNVLLEGVAGELELPNMGGSAVDPVGNGAGVVPVVDRVVDGLGGIVNGCGAPGTELADELVMLVGAVAP